MVDLYSPTQLVQVVNAVDVQKQLNALFTSLFFTRSVMFESRDIILDTIDDPNIPIAAFCSPMVGSKVSRDEGYESKTIRPGYMKPKSSIDPNKLAVRPAGVSPEQYNAFGARNIKVKQAIVNQAKEGANKRGNSSRLTQSFHFFMFEPIFSPVNALNQPI